MRGRRQREGGVHALRLGRELLAEPHALCSEEVLVRVRLGIVLHLQSSVQLRVELCVALFRASAETVV